MKIGYQGIAGSYSETITQRYLKETKNQPLKSELVSYTTFKELVEDLVTEKLDMGVFPVENSTTGLITRTLDLFRGQSIFVEEERYQDVRHTLWGLPDTSIEKLQKVYSHPEALRQSETFFTNHPEIEAVPFADTAEAARFIHEEQDPTKGALAGPKNGELYELMPLLNEMQSETTNTTRFFFTKHWKQLTPSVEDGLIEYNKKFTERTHWMLYIETKHQPGSLAPLLNVFNLFNCNLEGLDARPIKNKPFRYGFFIEVDVSHLAGDYQLLWKNLEYASEYLQIIGSFEPMPFEGGV